MPFLQRIVVYCVCRLSGCIPDADPILNDTDRANLCMLSERVGQLRRRTPLSAFRWTYSYHLRERFSPRQRRLSCNIVQCACCLTTTQSRSRTALNAARSAYLPVSPPEREGHPPPPSASPALQYRAMCMLSDYHAVTLPYCSECRSLGIPVLPPTTQQPAMCMPHMSSHAATPPSISILPQCRPPGRLMSSTEREGH